MESKRPEKTPFQLGSIDCHRLLTVIDQANQKKKLSGELTRTNLNRCLTTFDLTLLGLSLMVSGVFTVSGPVIASIAGPGIVISYLIGGVAASLSALCYAEMGARIPITGSGYLYVSLSAGELWGFLAGWNMLLEYMMTIAAMSRALTQSIETVIGGRNGSYALDSASFTLGGEKTDLLAAIIIIVFGVLVASGARMTSFVNNTCNMLAMALILACTIYAFTVANLDNWFGSSNGVSTFLPFGLGGAIEGTAIVYFGYIGFESITVSGEETVNPKSSVPVAIALALSMATLLFVLTSMALTLYVPYHDIFPGSAMIVAFMEHGSHAWGIVAAVAALLSIGTNVIMASFSLPRIMYAMASDGLLFGRLAEINSRTKSPLNSIIASTVVSALLAFFFSMDTLVKAVSIGTLYCYAMVAVGAILLRFQSMDYILEKQEDLVGTGTNKEQQTTPDECRVPQHNVSGTEKDLGESGLIIPGRRKAWVEKCCLRFWPDVGITTTVVAILVSISVMSFFVMLAFRLNVLGIWWNIAVIVVCAPLILLCVAHLCLYQQNEGTADSFRIPCMPVLPVLSIWINVQLMMMLPPATWIRLAIWVSVGLTIYVVFGQQNSHLRKNERIVDASNSPPLYGACAQPMPPGNKVDVCEATPQK